MRDGLLLVSLVIASLVFCAGCSDSARLPTMPPLNPTAIAGEAVHRYDTNGDGKLDAKELEAAPGLQAMLRTIKDHDAAHADSLTAADISARVAAWQENGGVLFSPRIRISMDGQRVADAVVTCEPEPCLGPSYHSSSGTTSKNGYAYLSPAMEGFRGLLPGVYTLRVSKKVSGKETIPACYNEKSILGREVAADVPDPEHVGEYDLKGKQQVQ